MTKTETKPNYRHTLARRSQVLGAVLSTGLATLAPNVSGIQKQPHKVEPISPLAQPATPNQRRQSTQEFLAASLSKKPPRVTAYPKKTPAPESIRKPRITPRMNISTKVAEKPAPVVELQNLHPENLSVPPEVSKIMHENVVYLPALGCSGFLIRSEDGEPIGILTAEHCGLRGADGRWGTSESGQISISFPQLLEAQTGDSLDDMTTIGQISQFLLSARDDTTHDETLGVFNGHSAEEVLNRYMQVSVPEIFILKKGDVIYNSGWPINQPNNLGSLKRQEFAMSALGSANWDISNGDSLNLLVAAVPISRPDGTECSWGNSGSAAFIINSDGKPQIIGTASAFNDFGYLYNKDKPSDAASEVDFISRAYKVDVTGYGAVCGFSYEPPKFSAGAVVADVNITPSYK